MFGGVPWGCALGGVPGIMIRLQTPRVCVCVSFLRACTLLGWFRTKGKAAICGLVPVLVDFGKETS